MVTPLSDPFDCTWLGERNKCSYNERVIRVVDKKVVKHLIDTTRGLLSIPVRIHFEYALESQRFVQGSMERRYLFNRDAVLKQLPELDPERLDREIEETVDRSLVEHVKFNHRAEGSVRLFPEPKSETADTGDDSDDEARPRIILP